MQLTQPARLPLACAARRGPRGFTLIELMVTLAVFAILSLLAIPSFNTWIANSRVRAVAEDMAGGLRLAQTEATRRSRQTVFALTGAANPGANSAGAPNYTAVANNSNWAVSVAQSMMDSSGVFVRGGAIADIGSGVKVQGPAVICFSPQGRLVSGSSALTTGVGSGCADSPTTQPAQVYKLTSASAAGDHPLQIEVGLGGQVRLCNPAYTSVGARGASEGCQYSQSSSGSGSP